MTDEFAAKPAAREAAPTLSAFVGRSGSGKTYSALLFARGLVGKDGKIVIIDTEGKRALIYADDADVGGFFHVDFRPPYSSDRFRQAVNQQIKDGANVIIIDSASHEHEGEGGMLEYADLEEARLGNSRRVAQQKWVKPKMAHTRFMTSIRSCPAHVILCIRQKMIVDVNKTPAEKILVPVAESSLLFDMDLVLELEPETHRAHFTKVPKPFLPFIREGDVIAPQHGELLMQEAGRGAARDDDAEYHISQIELAAREFGTKSVRLYLDKLTQEERVSLKPKLAPQMERLQQLAKMTDQRRAAEQDDSATEDGTATTPTGGQETPEQGSLYE